MIGFAYHVTTKGYKLIKYCLIALLLTLGGCDAKEEIPQPTVMCYRVTVDNKIWETTGIPVIHYRWNSSDVIEYIDISNRVIVIAPKNVIVEEISPRPLKDSAQ